MRGELNHADYCSNHKSTDHQLIVCRLTEAYINGVTAHVAHMTVTLYEIRPRTKTDLTLQTVANMI